jgi:anthranilate phosphoribosyltransferase
MLLYAAGKGPSIASCVPPARHALESGAAAKKLTALAARTAAAQAAAHN